MRDDWIFKIAIVIGVLAFLWRLVTFPAPPQQFNAANLSQQQRFSQQIAQAVNANDFVTAAVYATVRQQGQYMNHGGWHAISDALVQDPHPQTVLARWRSRSLASPLRSMNSVEESVLTEEDRDWLREFFEETGGESFVAYYLGVKLIAAASDSSDEALNAFRYSNDGFKMLLDEHPENATLWDRLYLARSYMRLRMNEQAAIALRDLESFFESQHTQADEFIQARGLFRAIGRTWINAGFHDQGIRVWKQINTALKVQADPLRIAQEWAQYGSGALFKQEPGLEAGVAQAMWDALQQIDLRDSNANTTEFHRMLESLVYRATGAGSSEIKQQAIVHLRAAHEQKYHGNEPDHALAKLALYEAMLGNRDLMYEALEKALRRNALNPNQMMSNSAYAPFRDEDRFQKILMEASDTAESAF